MKQMIVIEDDHLGTINGKVRATVAMINTSDNLTDNNFLFYKYVLRKRGFDVIFTGGILPASEVVEIYKIKPFDYLVVNSSAFDFAEKKIAYFTSIGKSLRIRKTILTDSPEEYKNKTYENLVLTGDPEDFLKVVDSLRTD